MKKNNLRFRIGAMVAAIACLFTVVLAEPGGSDDPLITKSYIENTVMPAIKEYVEGKIAEITGGENNSTNSSFQVVEAKDGKEIICSAGTEIILRMGQATIIATEKGGLADTTAGFDLGNETPMPSNHLLIVPLSDGRGIKAQSDIIVMIKGGYTIK